MTFPNCNIKTSEIIKQIFKREKSKETETNNLNINFKKYR